MSIRQSRLNRRSIVRWLKSREQLADSQRCPLEIEIASPSQRGKPALQLAIPIELGHGPNDSPNSS
jgi:hypothetical protein